MGKSVLMFEISIFMPRRIQRKRSKGCRMPLNDFYVGGGE